MLVPLTLFLFCCHLTPAHVALHLAKVQPLYYQAQHICACMLAFARGCICLVPLDYIIDYCLALDPGSFSSFSTLVSPSSSIPYVSPLFSSWTPLRTLSTVHLFLHTP